LEVLTEVPEAAWREFLSWAPGASIFQSPEMARVHERTNGYRPIVVAVASGNEIQALLASTVISYGPGRLSRFTARAVATGGPLGTPEAFPALLAAHDGLAGRLALLSQIRNLEPPADRAPFESAGYRWEDHDNFLIDLGKGEEGILREMAHSRRKGVARAERSGIDVVELGPRDVDAAYALLETTYARSGVPLAHKTLFVTAFEILAPKGHLWVLAALHEGIPCAVRFVLRWGATLYDWYAGSNDDARTIRADEWLVWQVFRKGITEGCGTFDFGGAGRPGEPYGPGEFKRQFGGTPFNPGRFEKVYRPLTLKATKAAYAVWQRLG
jgi:serine/alanine adding enzyme